jgi:hypothetical protein
MGVIVNPRGASGSGKTALVRRILVDYGWGTGNGTEPIGRTGRARPIGYRLRHPLGGCPLAVVGYYGAAACGGCDTIPARDGGLDEVFRLADGLAATGHNVLLEGLVLSGECRCTVELAHRHSLHVLRLDTPLEQCVSNLTVRRRASRTARPQIASTVAAQHDAITDACARLRWCAASVNTLAFDEALHQARELLGLRPTATNAGAWRWPARVSANFGNATAVTNQLPGELPKTDPIPSQSSTVWVEPREVSHISQALEAVPARHDR